MNKNKIVLGTWHRRTAGSFETVLKPSPRKNSKNFGRKNDERGHWILKLQKKSV
ncbi:MAG: hypothetical protein US35_C0020G0003 [Parcubacteria group bacterium GW2011_GWA2_37_10]|nr:MAG: hypothetical protein US35_C0020G0003 [Parcubacteria group bacterium GW2011_GWA2_37_10]